MTIPVLLTVFLLFILIVVVATVSKKSASRAQSHPASNYVALPTFLSPAERSFFGVLLKAIQNDYQVFAKVRLADLIKPENTSDRRHWQTSFNRISAKHVDFVICSTHDLSVKAVIELDDSSHTKPDRKQRDVFLDSALSSAKIPVLHVPASHTYSPNQLRADIETAINRKTTI